MDEATDWQRNVGTSKILARYKGSTISLQAAVHLGHMPRALMTKKKKKKRWQQTSYSVLASVGGERAVLYMLKRTFVFVAFCVHVLDTFMVTSPLDIYAVARIGMRGEQYQRTNDKVPSPDIGFTGD
jgi:hypothetical protein